ncbi:MAG TPA: ATP-binding protein [Acidimicrobiia bacterium]|nr:ATP-binding protein [Acidimicrobiia bacterium]
MTASLRRPGAAGVALRTAFACLVVAAVAGLLVAVSADFAFAVIVMLLTVVAASVLGYVPGLVAAVAACAVLVYEFAKPVHSFAIDRPDDILALVAFVAVSGAVASVVARLNELNASSRRAAREARLRLTTTNELLEGADPESVMAEAATELVTLFDLAACRLITAGASAEAEGTRPTVEYLTIDVPPLTADLALSRTLGSGERAMLDALVSGLAAAFDRVRLAIDARDRRVEAEIDRSRAGFLTAVTHDLRTPLATIKTAVAALLTTDSQLSAAERREMLEAAYEESARLERLVTKVLELTRVRAGALRPECGALSVPDLVRAAVTRLRPLSGERCIRLDVPIDLPAAWGDPTMLEQVLANLLENALRYAPPDREVSVSAREATGGLELRVVDHGPGVPEPDRDRVFEEFVSLDGAVGGTGVGLAVVRALVTVNGGRVWCEGTPGGGATFVFTVPSEPGAVTS